MLNALNDELLKKLYLYMFSNKWVDTHPARTEEFPSFIYRNTEKLAPEYQEEMLEQISICFSQVEKPKCDFNAYIYKFIGSCLDKKSIELNLEQLKVDFEQVGIVLDYFITESGHDDLNTIIDILFTSEKNIPYKGNDNIRILNTEIRIYTDYNLALVTNFSNYTHNASDKKKFIKEVLESISSHRGEIEPITLSDQTLRNLLIMNDKLPSKFKFEVEGRLMVGIQLKETGEYQNVIKHDEIKYFYDKYQLSVLKVKISDAEDKYLNVNGVEGKLTTRSHLEVDDIDSFMITLSKLLHYDYLNYTYENEIKNKARMALSGGTNYQKDNIVRICYKLVNEKFAELFGDAVDIGFINVARNAFFYCLFKNIFVIGQNKYQLDSYVLKYLSKIVGFNDNVINVIFSSIVDTYHENRGSLQDFILGLNKIINDKRLVSNASGL